ncbi:MAG: WXG100 family type VII secretion target [Pseudonocardiaceae bacterium]
MSGFDVTPEGLRTVRDLLGSSAADVTSTRGSWDSATRDLGAAFATAECGQAFSEFQQYLFESLGSRRELLEGLASAAGHSANDYESTDGTETQRFGSPGSGVK